MATVFLVSTIALAACFAFLNGFRDVSTAVAVAVRTRALTPTVAVLMAGLFNVLGALLSVGFAAAMHDRLVTLPSGEDGLGLLTASLAGTCLWGIYQWWRGYPSSSTHALIGSLVGASLASTLVGEHPLQGLDSTLITLVVLPLLLSPVIAFALSYVAVFPAVWGARYSQPNLVHLQVRRMQSVAAAAVAFGHGLQDGARTTTVLLLALGAAGLAAADHSVPLWVPVFTAVMLCAGTLAGGWRISHTLGTRLGRIDPMRGLVAQSISAVLLFVGAIAFHLPLSTTHTVTSSIVGAGLNQRFSTTNGPLMLRILGTWVLTPIATAAMGAVLYLAISPII